MIEELGQCKSNNDLSTTWSNPAGPNKLSELGPNKSPGADSHVQAPVIPVFTLSMTLAEIHAKAEKFVKELFPGSATSRVPTPPAVATTNTKKGAAIGAIAVTPSSLCRSINPHYEIRDVDEDQSDMEIADDQKEEIQAIEIANQKVENWQNPETFTFEKYMNGFTQTIQARRQRRHGNYDCTI